VVVVSNAGRLRGPRHQRTLDLLTQGIPTLPDFSTLILVAWAEEAGERRGKNPFPEKLMAAIRAAGKAVQFAPLKPEELARLAVTEAEAAGKKMVLAAAAMLAERAGPESYPVVQEARKLAAYVGDRPTITAQDVAVMVAPRPDDNVFHLLDATMSGDRRQALSLLGQLRESGMAVQQIIPMLARTLRQVAQAKYLSDQRIASTADGDQVPPEVRARLPQDGSLYAGGSPWLRKRLWEQARRISWSHLHQALDRLAVTDAGTKGWERGVEDPDLALELFVASLCETMQPAGASRSPGR